MRTFILFIALLATGLAFAQAQQDVRLSPLEPLVDNLPNQYRIQSAETIGSRTLVVWGTSRNVSSEQVAGQLRFQLLDGGTLFGPQRVLTSDDAEPQTFVRVIPLASRFLVIWLDRRIDSAGLYAMTVDLNGNKLNAERRIGPVIESHKTFGTQAWIAGTPENGQLLYWHVNDGARTWVTGLRIDPSGNVSASPIEVGHILQEILHHEKFPGMTFLRFDDRTVLIDRAGQVDKRSVYNSLFQGAYHLDTDTTILRLNGTMVEKYTSPFATEPEWSLEVPALDSAAGKTGLITRNSTGKLIVYFVTVELVGHYPGIGRQYTNGYQIEIVNADSITSPTIIYSDTHGYGYLSDAFSADLYYHNKAWTTTGCHNSGLLSIELEYIIYYHGSFAEDGLTHDYFSVSNTGELRADTSGYIKTCKEPPFPISRINTNNISTVRLTVQDSITITLQASIARTQLDTDQRNPTLIRVNDSIHFCFWQDKKSGAALSRIRFPLSAPQPTYYSWGTASGIEMPRISSGGHYANVSSIGIVDQRNVVRSIGTLAVEINIGNRVDVEEVYSPYESWTYSHYFYGFVLHLPGINGWNRKFQESRLWYTYGRTSTIIGVKGKVLGYDPSRKEWLVLTGVSETSQEPTTWRLNAVNTEGNAAWKIDSVPTPEGQFIPVNNGQYLLVSDTSATLYNGKSVAKTYAMAAPPERAYYQRLVGPYFMRFFSLGSDDMWQLEKYHLQGERIAQVQVRFPHLAQFPSITQNPLDSTIALVFGAYTNGVHATLLTDNLQVIVEDTTVGQWRGKALNPSGLFVGDTLFVAWEDYRNGKPDIYGNSFVPPSVSTQTNGVQETIQQATTLNVSVRPNPAYHVLHLQFSSLLEADAAIQLFDITGRLAWIGTLQRGASAETIFLNGLRNGVYHLHWKSGQQHGVHQVIVLR